MWPELAGIYLCARSAAQIAFTASRISLSAGSLSYFSWHQPSMSLASLRSLFGIFKSRALGLMQRRAISPSMACYSCFRTGPLRRSCGRVSSDG